MAQGGDLNSISPSLLENSEQQNGDEVFSNGGEESTWNKTVPPRQHFSSSSSCYSDDDTAPSVSIEDRFVNLNHWVCCICIVTFDLELGQALETIYPSSYQLSDSEKSNICYLAFPDSNSGCMGDTQYHIKLRCSGPGDGGTSLQHSRDHIGAPLVLTPDDSHYYGFVYFRQVKDTDIKRGYFQKSVVLLTRLPYITFFTFLVEKLAPDYFRNGIPSLEAACHNINKWPPPRPGQLLQLPLMGQLIYVRIPLKTDKPETANINMPDTVGKSPAMVVIPSVHELNLYQSLNPVLPHFETVWELVLINEPIVVMSSSPTLCANAVQALISLIHPLKYCSDYRPFFTIHDTEFKHYTTRTQAPPQVVLGVTNPFFSKTLEHWPNIIRITDQSIDEGKSMTSRRNTSSQGGDSKAGISTKHKPHLSKNKLFGKLLHTKGVTGGKRPLEVQNAMIRRHALELTTNFIIPLERYLASLMPLKRDVSPWRPPPTLKEFDEEQFIKMVEGAGPHMTAGIRGNWGPLYKKFLQSPNFIGWYRVRREEANQKLRLIQLEMLCKADVLFWMKDKQEVEIIDFLLQVKQCIKIALMHHPTISTQTLQCLQRLIHNVIMKLPEDLQSCLKTTFGN